MNKLRSDLRWRLKTFALNGEPFDVFYDGRRWRVRRGEVCAVVRIPEWDETVEIYSLGYCNHYNDAQSIITALQVIKLESIGRRLALW